MAKYLRKIRFDFDWRAIRNVCERNLEVDPDCPECEKGSYILGTVMGLSPSGKYYTPFASSNVEPCPGCNGKGRIPNPQADARVFDIAFKLKGELISELVKQYGSPRECWPSSLVLFEEYFNKTMNMTNDTISCPACDGVGSIEARDDEEWSEDLETVAQEYGLSIESGEGDPCDLFAVLIREVAEKEEE